jgi:hypothetical protein
VAMAICIKCFGSRTIMCPSHSGKKCPTCRGVGSITCTFCNGSGKSK